jgi:ABC-type amino acid transport substrate-binding protein
LQREPALRLATAAVTVEPYALVVRKDDQSLLAQLNAGLGRLQTAGELEQIIGHWLD